MANYTILLIDYEPRSIEQLRGPLVAAGYRVEIAKDGLTGIERFDRLSPDLTLVEAMIPKKHGFEVCQELKKTPHGKSHPVIIITGVYKGRKYRSQAKHQYGCDEYLEKPIAPENLLAVVERFLPGKPQPQAPSPSVAATAAPPSPPPPTLDDPGGEEPEIEIITDSTESEIVEHIDSILPGEPPSSSPRGSVDRGDDDRNVLVFDRARSRGRDDGPTRSVPAGPGAAGGGTALARQPAPEVEGVLAPAPARPGPAASDPALAPPSGRLVFWIAFVAALIATGAIFVWLR